MRLRVNLPILRRRGNTKGPKGRGGRESLPSAAVGRSECSAEDWPTVGAKHQEQAADWMPFCTPARAGVKASAKREHSRRAALAARLPTPTSRAEDIRQSERLECPVTLERGETLCARDVAKGPPTATSSNP